MRNYRSISSPDSWTYVFVKNLSEGADADKPNLNDGVLFSFESYAQGLGYRSSDQTLWGVEHNFSKLSKYSITGELLDFWNLYSGSNGCEIDGDNDDFLWVTTRFSAIEKYRLSTKTNVPESKFENMSEYGGYVNSVNGICAPAGEFIYFGISGDGIVRKARKVDGVIIADYPVSDEPSDLAWDGTNIWVSYATDSRIDCYNPTDFTLVSTFNGPYANHQGLTYDGKNLWASYPAGNLIAKLGNASSSPAKLYYATDTETIYWNVDGKWEEVPKGTGVDNFLGFIDSPDSYEGQAGKIVVVNSTEDGLEFITLTEPPPPQAVGVTSIAKSGSASMTGDISFQAGANVTLTQDEATKRIIISASGGTGGGGSAASDYSIDTPPIIPSPYDDEFEDGIVDSKWIVINPVTSVISEGSIYPNTLTIDASSISQANVVSLIQPLPAGNLEIMGKCRIEGDLDLAGQVYSGICLKGSTIATDPIYGVTLRIGTNTTGLTLRPVRLSTHINPSFYVKMDMPVGLSDTLYVKLIRLNNAWSMAISSNGLSWQYFRDTVNLNFVPTHFGILTYKSTTVTAAHVKARAHFDWIRLINLP